MNYTKIIKRETKTMAVIVAVLTMLITGVSYALFMRVDSSANNQVVTTGDLRISYSSTNGYINGNTYPEIMPLTNTEGLAQTGYEFSVENVGSLSATYGVYLYVDSASYTNDNPGGSLFDDTSLIKYNLETNNSTTGNISTLGSRYKKTEGNIDKYEIYAGTLANKNDKDNHILKIWLDDKTDVENIGKYVYLKLEVQGNVTGQREETNAYTVTFDANGGTMSSNSKSVVVGQNYGELPVPTRDGYTFKGWNGKNKVNVENHNETYSNDYFIQLTPLPKYELEPNTTYTLSFDYVVNSASNGLIVSVGYGINNYDYDVRYGAGYSGTGRYTTTFTTSNSFSVTPPNVAFRLARMSSPGSANVDISNVQFEKNSEATEYEPYYVTSSTRVTQNKNHTLTAIWEAN